METTGVLLRRFETQLAFDTAFLFFDVRGALMEKWGYSPGFDSNAIGPDTAQVNGADSDRESRLLQLNAKSATCVLEGLHWPDARDLNAEWWRDICQALRPRYFRRLMVRAIYAVELQDTRSRDRRAKVNSALRAVYGGLDGLTLDGWDVNPGISFNANRDGVFSTLQLGVLTEEQARGFFLSHPSGDDGGLLALNVDYVVPLTLPGRPPKDGSSDDVAEVLLGHVNDAQRHIDGRVSQVLLPVVRRA